MVNTVLALHRAQVQSLVGELRSCMLHDVTKNNNNSFISMSINVFFFFFLIFWLHHEACKILLVP